jgi:hypothetical protein
MSSASCALVRKTNVHGSAAASAGILPGAIMVGSENSKKRRR